MRETDLAPSPARSASSLADWAETVMLAERMHVFGTAQLRRRLSSMGEGDTSEVELLLNEVADRHRIAPTVYPFRSTEVGVELRRDADSLLYAFLVLASVPGTRFREAREYGRAAIIFDLIVMNALRGVLGAGSKAIRFAWPTTADRPSSFPAAIEWLASRIGIEPGVVAGPPRKKDGGVDVIGWRQFRDRRASFPVVLAQCTIRTEFLQKAQDILLEQWRAWLSFSRPPATAVAVPFAVPTTASEWDEDLRFTSDLVLDRMRICELLEVCEPPVEVDVSWLQSWVDAELDALLTESPE